MTKKEKIMYENWLVSENYSVRHAYDRPSASKIYAEERIIDEMVKNGGWGYRVTSHNTFNFACAYKYMKDGVECMVYHTHANRYEFTIA